ncbi:NAD(P)-binding domain-containing protein [Saccharopolyspora sp. MS10]|uniref:NAD(P)-binding domain-containing protein n=1 Tax=Saccharopolyspora sp. MS10 TaxID=3385973 RepID=UPI0039A178CB
MSVHEVEIVVVGAGQAGLSSAHHLRRAGFEPGPGFAVLDADAGPGGAWRHRWPSLRLGEVHGIHDLPGFALTERDGSRPASAVLSEYFDRYEREFGLDVRRPVRVRAVRRGPGGRLLVESGDETWSARAVINATGTWSKPFVPRYPGQEEFAGRQLHVAGYRGAAEFRGSRVAVVGGGISAVELLTEIAEVGATTWVTRRPPVFGDREFTPELGRRAVAEVERRVRDGLPPGSVVSATGLPPTPAVLRARERGVLDRLPMFERITPAGLRWADGREVEVDVILWATGFRAALDHLAPLKLRERGGGIRVEGTRVLAEPRLHLVGYGPSASTVGASRAGRAAAREVRELLAPVTEA